MRSALVILLVWVSVGAAAAANPTAHKQPRRFALRDLRVEGNATADERKLLTERVFSTVELMVSDQGDELVHPEDVIAGMAGHADWKTCFDARCGLEVGEALKVDKVLSIGIERSGAQPKGEWTVRIWHFDVRSLRVLPSTDLPCHACTAEEVLGDLSHSLEPVLKSAAVPVCTLKIAARPEGSKVSIDATPMGEAPFTHTIAAGRHEISVERKGFSRGEDAVDCPAGSSQSVVFALTEGVGLVRREEAPAPTGKRSPALKALGASLLVLGVAGIAAGAAELAIDGKGTCSLSSGRTQCKEVYDTGAAGAALVALGGVAVVGGAITFVVDAMRARPSRVQADVRVGPQTAYAGVRGSF
jgi:hypothetical protein